MEKLSKAQQAALLRVDQIKTDLQERLMNTIEEFEKWPGLTIAAREKLLNPIETMFDTYTKEVANLVDEHSLEDAVLSKFKNESISEIYNTSGSLQCYAWQARFAKKNGM